MKTKLVRPVLVASKEQTNLWSYKGRRMYYNQANFNDEDETTYYRVVLVSLDPNDKIDVGNLYLTLNGNTFKQIVAKCNEDSVYFANNTVSGKNKTPNKVIATQDQLSPDHIHKLVDEYNNGGMQDFEIEMGWVLGDKEDENQNLIPVLQPKLTNNFITIVEKEHNIPYPEEPVEEDGELIFSDETIEKMACFPTIKCLDKKLPCYNHNKCMLDDFLELHNEIIYVKNNDNYTPQDLLEVMNWGMSLRQSQLNGSDSRSGNEVLYQWIQNKKK